MKQHWFALVAVLFALVIVDGIEERIFHKPNVMMVKLRLNLFANNCAKQENPFSQRALLPTLSVHLGALINYLSPGSRLSHFSGKRVLLLVDSIRGRRENYLLLALIRRKSVHRLVSWARRESFCPRCHTLIWVYVIGDVCSTCQTLPYKQGMSRNMDGWLVHVCHSFYRDPTTGPSWSDNRSPWLSW